MPDTRRGRGKPDVLQGDNATGCGSDVLRGVDRRHRRHGVPLVNAPTLRRDETVAGLHLGLALDHDVVVTSSNSQS